MKSGIVFTNGCFDIIHPGHIKLLKACKALGNQLIVGLNSDSSVSRIKPGRPINDQDSRKCVLESIRWVDTVIIFDDDTPLRLIQLIRPNVLVKGGDWDVDKIIGSEFVKSYGGQVHSIPLLYDCSTTSIINRIKTKID